MCEKLNEMEQNNIYWDSKTATSSVVYQFWPEIFIVVGVLAAQRLLLLFTFPVLLLEV